MNTIQLDHLGIELDAWCMLQGLEPQDVAEMLEDGNLTDYQLAWLKDFANRWCWLEDGKFWISGRLRHPDSFTEQTTWYRSQQFETLVTEWGKPVIPEGYEAARVEMVNATHWVL
jgi:hypothetical protein